MAKNKKNRSTSEPYTSGAKKGFYFPEKDLDLIEFLENQPESASKIVVKLVREYKNSLENQKTQVSNNQIMDTVISNQEKLVRELEKIKEMLYYRPVIIDSSTKQINQEITPTLKEQIKYNSNISDKELDDFE